MDAQGSQYYYDASGRLVYGSGPQQQQLVPLNTTLSPSSSSTASTSLSPFTPAYSVLTPMTPSLNAAPAGQYEYANSDMALPPYKIKHRRRTSPPQLKVLERQFETNPKPDINLRKHLAEQLQMTPREVQVWFQNRRAKVKKMAANPSSAENTPSNGTTKPGPSPEPENATVPLAASTEYTGNALGIYSATPFLPMSNYYPNSLYGPQSYYPQGTMSPPTSHPSYYSAMSMSSVSPVPAHDMAPAVPPTYYDTPAYDPTGSSANPNQWNFKKAAASNQE